MVAEDRARYHGGDDAGHDHRCKRAGREGADNFLEREESSCEWRVEGSTDCSSGRAPYEHHNPGRRKPECAPEPRADRGAEDDYRTFISR